MLKNTGLKKYLRGTEPEKDHLMDCSLSQRPLKKVAPNQLIASSLKQFLRQPISVSCLTAFETPNRASDLVMAW